MTGLRLGAEDRAVLDERFPAGPIPRTPRDRRRPRAGANKLEGEVVLVAGLPGAGNSTIALDLANRGYARLNRDEAGGTLAALLPVLDRQIRAPRSKAEARAP